jgi:hypothetical protein
MIEFFREGGWGMWLVVALGGATLVTAALFAREPDERRITLLRSLTIASIFSIATAVFSNLATVMHTVPNRPEWAEGGRVHLVVMIGIGESLAPAILGGSFLTLAWLVAAVGVRRLADRLARA